MTILGIVLLSTSCLKLDGSLRVTESLSVKEKYGFLNLKTRTIKIDPATYSAVVKVKSDKNMVLQLESGKKTIDIPVKAEKDLNIPRDGKFTIAGSKIGQPFNINGVINTDYESSPETRTVESCTINSTRTECERVCDKATGKCERVCRDITISIDGHRDVIYHYSTVTRTLELELSKAGSSAVAATFNGRDTDTSKVYDMEGSCRIGRR